MTRRMWSPIGLGITDLVVAMGVFELGGCAQAPESRITQIQAPSTAVARLTDTRRFPPGPTKTRMTPGAALLLTAAPPNWPKGLAWRPRRNFGPFYRGSDFLSVKVLVEGQTAKVYYGQFLVTHPDVDIFKKYYGSSLPSADVSWNALPGRFPGCTQTSLAVVNNIVLALIRVRWSARYGGSVELLFRSQEDFEGELCYHGGTWDLGSLEMFVYVTPSPVTINGVIQGAHIVVGSVRGVEIRSSNETAYDANGTPLSDPTASGALGMALADLSKALLSSNPQSTLGFEATRFAYAFLHSQFQDDLGPFKVVDTIEISDDFLDLKTHVGQPYVRIELRIVIISLEGKDNIDIGVSTHRSDWDPYESFIHFPGTDDGEGTGFRTTMLLPLAACDPSSTNVDFWFDVTVDDEFYDSTIHRLSVFNCAELQSRYTAAKFGVIHEWRLDNVGLNNLGTDSRELEGWLASDVRLSLNLQ